MTLNNSVRDALKLDALKRLNTLKICTALIVLTALNACSGTSYKVPKWATGDSQCRQIGCGQGLNFYPNEKFGAKRQAKDWYGWQMGKTSTAYPPSDPKHWELKAKEQAAGQTPWHWNNQ
tara:strand:+ start:122 stop:481 length:360 start_codon:yes stop_codon:yes gene_type:complete